MFAVRNQPRPNSIAAERALVFLVRSLSNPIMWFYANAIDWDDFVCFFPSIEQFLGRLGRPRLCDLATWTPFRANSLQTRHLYTGTEAGHALSRWRLVGSAKLSGIPLYGNEISGILLSKILLKDISVIKYGQNWWMPNEIHSHLHLYFTILSFTIDKL